MSDEYFEKAQRKIISGGDTISDYAIQVAREIYDEAGALKPVRDGELLLTISFDDHENRPWDELYYVTSVEQAKDTYLSEKGFNPYCSTNASLMRYEDVDIDF